MHLSEEQHAVTLCLPHSGIVHDVTGGSTAGEIFSHFGHAQDPIGC